MVELGRLACDRRPGDTDARCTPPAAVAPACAALFLARTSSTAIGSSAESVLSPPLVCPQVLPRFFKHNKLGSFTQQLHTYGFTRRGNDSPFETQMIFSHEHFRQGEPEKLYLIRRSVAGTVPTRTDTNAGDGSCTTETQAARGADSAGSAPTEALLSEQLQKLEQALTTVEGAFRQHEEQTRHAMVAIGATLADFSPPLSGLLGAVVGVPMPQADPRYGGDDRTRLSAAIKPPAANPDVAGKAQHESNGAASAHATLLHLTAVAEDAREVDARSDGSSGGGSDDRCGSGSHERSGSEDRGSDRGSEQGSEKSNERGSEKGSAAGSLASGGGSAKSGNSGGGCSDSSKAASCSSNAASASSNAASSSSAEPRSDLSHSSGSGAPTSTSISSG